MCAHYRRVCMNVCIYSHELKTRFWLDVSRLWHMPWNLSLSMWEPSAAWPYLEENDRTLLLATDNAWTRQWAWRGVQQFTPCFWQQLCLHHLKINVIQIKQITRICYHFLVWAFFFFFDLTKQLVTDELALAFPVTSSSRFIRFMVISKCQESAAAFEHSLEFPWIFNCC